MRDFSWNVFKMTGDVDAYLLYRASDERNEAMDEETEEEPNDTLDPLN